MVHLYPIPLGFSKCAFPDLAPDLLDQGIGPELCIFFTSFPGDLYGGWNLMPLC